MEDYDEEVARHFIEYLVEEGCMEVSGVDQNGDFVLSVTPKMQEMFPEIWQEIITMSNELIYDLWQKDLVDIVFGKDGEVLVAVNSNTLEYRKYDLTEEEVMMIETIINKDEIRKIDDYLG